MKWRGKLLFQTELECACVEHMALILALKNDYIDHFINQGVANFKAQEKGTYVGPSCIIHVKPLRCIVCCGDMEAAIAIVDTHEHVIPHMSWEKSDKNEKSDNGKKAPKAKKKDKGPYKGPNKLTPEQMESYRKENKCF